MIKIGNNIFSWNAELPTCYTFIALEYSFPAVF